MTRTAVLTSKENFAWTSMQEILPQLEADWLGSGHPDSHRVSSLDIDRATWPEILGTVLNADNVVLTCFNVRMATVARELRARFGIEARYFVHLHNQATIACWPFHQWELAGVLREDDVFLSSCTRDANTFTHSFLNARVEVVPFTLPGPVAAEKHFARGGDHDFVFVGRLSVQKNLHTLLHAFRAFLNANAGYGGRLVLIGGEDGLGSPNMGEPSSGYGQLLRDLAERLAIQTRVEFTGFREREGLHTELARRPHVFISPSLHSDENFGMAAFRSLCLGFPAVLTDWGGHADFSGHFAGQVYTVPVYGTDSGPWLDPTELAASMTAAINADYEFAGIPDYYRSGTVRAKLHELAREPVRPARPLQATALAQQVLAQRRVHLEESKNPCKIFTCYRDPSARPFFQSYGMRAPTAGLMAGLTTDVGGQTIGDPSQRH